MHYVFVFEILKSSVRNFLKDSTGSNVDEVAEVIRDRSRRTRPTSSFRSFASREE